MLKDNSSFESDRESVFTNAPGKRGKFLLEPELEREGEISVDFIGAVALLVGNRAQLQRRKTAYLNNLFNVFSLRP